MSQQRQAIPVTFFISESVAIIIQNIANVSTKPVLQEVFQTNTQINKELKRTEFDGAFSSLFLLHRENHLSRENDPSKEKQGHQMSKIVKFRQSYSNGYLPYHCSFYYLVRAVRTHRKDAQKQLKQTSLRGFCYPTSYLRWLEPLSE